MNVVCPKCNRNLRITDDLLGKQVKCPGCAQTLKLNAPTPSAPASPAPPAPKPTTSESMTIACRCSAKLKLPNTARGQTVRCPKCQVMLRVPAGSVNSSPAPQPTPPQPTPPQPAAAPPPPDLSANVFDSLPSVQPTSQTPGYASPNPHARPLQSPALKSSPGPYPKASSSRVNANAGTYVVYRYAISILVMSFHLSSGVKHIPPGGNRFLPGLPYTLLSMMFGLWGIPWGPLFTIASIYRNCCGGLDVTEEVRLAQRGG